MTHHSHNALAKTRVADLRQAAAVRLDPRRQRDESVGRLSPGVTGPSSPVGRQNLATLIVAFCVTIAIGIGGYIPTIGLTSAHAAQCNGECEFSDEEGEVFTAP